MPPNPCGGIGGAENAGGAGGAEKAMGGAAKLPPTGVNGGGTPGMEPFKGEKGGADETGAPKLADVEGGFKPASSAVFHPGKEAFQTFVSPGIPWSVARTIGSGIGPIDFPSTM